MRILLFVQNASQIKLQIKSPSAVLHFGVDYST